MKRIARRKFVEYSGVATLVIAFLSDRLHLISHFLTSLFTAATAAGQQALLDRLAIYRMGCSRMTCLLTDAWVSGMIDFNRKRA